MLLVKIGEIMTHIKDSFFNLISSRHSVRAFKNEIVSEEIIEKILNAANKADSAGNLQSYKIFVVTKKDDKRNLTTSAFDQKFIEDASILLVFCADLKTSAKEYGKRGEELFCIQDATIACCYSQLASQALDLSSVWVGSFDEQQVRNNLGLGHDLKPVAILVIGYPNEIPEITPRKSLNEISYRI